MILKIKTFSFSFFVCVYIPPFRFNATDGYTEVKSYWHVFVFDYFEKKRKKFYQQQTNKQTNEMKIANNNNKNTSRKKKSRWPH